MAKITKPVSIKEFREAAGIIATNWSEVEDLIEAYVWGLAKVKPRHGRALTTHIGFVTQCNIVKLLLADKFPEKFKPEEWVVFANRIETLRMARNTIVHARWEAPITIGDKPALLAFEYKAKSSLREAVVVCSHPYMMEVGEDIKELTKDLRRYFQQTFSLSPSLYRPVRQQSQNPRPQGKTQTALRRPPRSSQE